MLTPRIPDLPDIIAALRRDVEWLKKRPAGGGGGAGSPGPEGPAGRSVTSAAVNASGDLIVTYSDNTTVNVGHVVGAQGDRGPVGPSPNALAYVKYWLDYGASGANIPGATWQRMYGWTVQEGDPQGVTPDGDARNFTLEPGRWTITFNSVCASSNNNGLVTWGLSAGVDSIAGVNQLAVAETTSRSGGANAASFTFPILATSSGLPWQIWRYATHQTTHYHSYLTFERTA